MPAVAGREMEGTRENRGQGRFEREGIKGRDALITETPATAHSTTDEARWHCFPQGPDLWPLNFWVCLLPPPLISTRMFSFPPENGAACRKDVREMNTPIRDLRDRSHSLAARIRTCYIPAESSLGSLELRLFEQNVTTLGNTPYEMFSGTQQPQHY